MPDRACPQPARAAWGGMLRTAALLGGFTLVRVCWAWPGRHGSGWAAARRTPWWRQRLPHVLRRLLGEGSCP
ncbi:MAG: hypothetical protein ACLU98_00715 [Desulfovibrio fairfieldensis]